MQLGRHEKRSGIVCWDPYNQPSSAGSDRNQRGAWLQGELREWRCEQLLEMYARATIEAGKGETQILDFKSYWASATPSGSTVGRVDGRPVAVNFYREMSITSIGG